MYFTNFDSFRQAVADAKWIEVRVMPKAGADIVVRVPIAGHADLLADIENAHVAKTALDLWDRDARKIVSIPYDQINQLSIKFDQ